MDNQSQFFYSSIFKISISPKNYHFSSLDWAFKLICEKSGISGSSDLPLVITYSFMTTVPNYYDIDGDSVNVDGNLATLLQPFSEDTTKFIVDALKLYSDIANIQFQEVDETANGGEGGTLNFGYAFLTDQMGMSDAAGLAYTPSSLLEFPYSPNFDKKIGDIWIDRNET